MYTTPKEVIFHKYIVSYLSDEFNLLLDEAISQPTHVHVRDKGDYILIEADEFITHGLKLTERALQFLIDGFTVYAIPAEDHPELERLEYESAVRNEDFDTIPRLDDMWERIDQPI